MTKKLSLEDLSALWNIHKQSEEQAKQERLAIEEQIVSLMPGPDEGTVSAVEGRYQIKAVRKLSRSIDPEAYLKVKDQLPSNINIVKTKYELNTKVIKAIEKANPDLYAKIAEFITTKPAKVAVKVEVRD